MTVTIQTATGNPAGDNRASEALGLWEPQRTLTLGQARRHSVRIKVLRRALVVFSVALAGVVGWQFSAQPAGFDLADNPNDSVRMTNPRYSGRTADNLPYYLTAGEAVREAGKANAVMLAAPVLDFYRAPGAAVSKIMAAQGVYNDRDKVLDLAGAVDLKTDDGYQCQTAQARIMARDKIINGGEPIACQGNFGTVNGNAFEITDNYKTFIFKDGMDAVIERDASLASQGSGRNSVGLGFGGDGPIAITATQGTYQSATTTLDGNVVVIQDGTRITSDNMVIERAQLPKDGAPAGSLKLGAVTTINATGNFVYITPERTVRGDSGVYEREKEIITVTGNVALTQPSGAVVRGSRMTYNLRTKNAQFGERCVGENCGRVTFGTGQ